MNLQSEEIENNYNSNELLFTKKEIKKRFNKSQILGQRFQKPYTLEFKYKVIKVCENLKNTSEVSRRMNVPRRTIGGWINEKDEIKEQYFKSGGRYVNEQLIDNEIDKEFIEYRNHLNNQIEQMETKIEYLNEQESNGLMHNNIDSVDLDENFLNN